MQGLRAGDLGYRPVGQGPQPESLGACRPSHRSLGCYVGRRDSRSSRGELSSQTSQRNVIHSSIQAIMVEQRPKTDQDSAPPGAAILAGESDDKQIHLLMWL